MPEWVGYACLFAGCISVGVLVGVAIAAACGFCGGYMWSGLLGRRDAKTMLGRMIRDEAARVAVRATREDVEAVQALVKRTGEMAEEILRTMGGRDAVG